MHNDHVVTHNNGNSDIEITVRHTFKEVKEYSRESGLSSDIVDCNDIKIIDVKLNGISVFSKFNSMANVSESKDHGIVLRLYNVTIGGNNHDQALVKINKKVEEEITAPYFANKKEIYVHEMSDHEKQLCKKCESICYGDCEAN